MRERGMERMDGFIVLYSVVAFLAFSLLVIFYDGHGASLAKHPQAYPRGSTGLYLVEPIGGELGENAVVAPLHNYLLEFKTFKICAAEKMPDTYMNLNCKG